MFKVEYKVFRVFRRGMPRLPETERAFPHQRKRKQCITLNDGQMAISLHLPRGSASASKCIGIYRARRCSSSGISSRHVMLAKHANQRRNGPSFGLEIIKVELLGYP